MTGTLPHRHFATSSRAAAACWLAAAILYLVTEAMSASAFSPAYSYARNYISDLGVAACGSVFDGRTICSPLHGSMNAGFVAQGLLFFGGAIAIARAIEDRTKLLLVGLAAINGIGIGLVGLFPENGATEATAGLHVLGAFMAITAGNGTALTSAFAFRGLHLPSIHRRASLALPSLAAAALLMLLVGRHSVSVTVFRPGVWERLSVYPITAWEVLSAVCLLARPVLDHGRPTH